MVTALSWSSVFVAKGVCGGTPVDRLDHQVLPPTVASMTSWDWEWFASVDDQIRDLAIRCIEGRCPEAVPFKAGRVWAVGEWVIKQGPYRRLRRAAHGWKRIQPIPAPEPLLLGRKGRKGLLIMRRCPGVPLHTAWNESAAREALPALIAELFRRAIMHGDLHLANLLWDGERLWLIDLDGLRPPLHRLLWRRLLRKQWAWLVHRLPHATELESLHADCCRRLGLADPTRRWARVLDSAAALRRKGLHRPPRARLPP